MLHLIPAPLHRLLYRAAYTLRRQWWRVRRPRRSSVVVVAFDERGRVLLARHSYGPPLWSLPGGGMNRAERPEQAAAREIREELGCGLADPTAIDASEQRIAGSRDMQHIFAAGLLGEPVPDMREVVAVGLFDPEHLPEQCGQRTRHWIARAVALRPEPAPSEKR
jgi:8-oxo-dGTP pyrophosphatase MutT (NUDIX family)